MSFPLDYQKDMCWPIESRNERRLIDAFMRIAVAELQRAQASDIQATESTIDFSVRFFRWASSWNLLHDVTRGSIEIGTEAGTICVRYVLSFSRLVAAFGAIALISFVWPVRRETFPPFWLKLFGPAIFFSFVFALNCLITIGRFSRFVKSIFAQAVSESSDSGS